MSASMNYRVRITKSCGDTQEYALAAEEVSIGSDPGADICLLGETSLFPNTYCSRRENRSAGSQAPRRLPSGIRTGSPCRLASCPGVRSCAWGCADSSFWQCPRKNLLWQEAVNATRKAIQ